MKRKKHLHFGRQFFVFSTAFDPKSLLKNEFSHKTLHYLKFSLLCVPQNDAYHLNSEAY